MSRRAPLLSLTISLGLTIAVCLFSACGSKEDEPAPAPNKAERDSVLSESSLPGAAAVKGALAVSDSARARADRASSAADGDN